MASDYVPLWAAAALLGRPQATIRLWVRQDRVPRSYDEDGRLLVDRRAVLAEHERAGRRRRRAVG